VLAEVFKHGHSEQTYVVDSSLAGCRVRQQHSHSPLHKLYPPEEHGEAFLRGYMVSKRRYYYF
jgi:hypothetical protein